MKIFLFFIVLTTVFNSPEKVIKNSLKDDTEVISVTLVENDAEGYLRDYIQRFIWNCNYVYRKQIRHLNDLYGVNAGTIRSVEIIKHNQKIKALEFIKQNTKLTSQYVYNYKVILNINNKNEECYYMLTKDNKIVAVISIDLLDGIIFKNPIDFVNTISEFYIY